MKMSREMFSLYTLKGLQWAAWGVSAISCAVGAMLFLTPFILPILTLGAVVINDRIEYVEYAFTSFSMALFPLLISALSALAAYGLRFGRQRMQIQAKRAEAERIDLERMRNLAKQNAARRFS